MPIPPPGVTPVSARGGAAVGLLRLPSSLAVTATEIPNPLISYRAPKGVQKDDKHCGFVQEQHFILTICFTFTAFTYSFVVYGGTEVEN